jgi:hypothetical protein
MLFAGSKSRRIVVASRSRWLRKRTAKADVLGMTLGQFLGSHEYANRLRPHAGSMGNVEGASGPGVRVFQTESLCSRAVDRTPSCRHERQSARYYADRAQGPDPRLIQTVGRRGLRSGLSPGLTAPGPTWHLTERLPRPFPKRGFGDGRGGSLEYSASLSPEPNPGHQRHASALQRGLVANPG